jgi:hypothetical protein
MAAARSAPAAHHFDDEDQGGEAPDSGALSVAFAIRSVTTSTRGDLPVLRSWLEGVGDHPLRWFFKSRRDTPRPPNTVYAWWRNPILVAMEETLAILEAAQPNGLGAKRRDFRAFKLRAQIPWTSS